MENLAGTKLDLIMAAGELFVEHGLEGTSTRAIAARAGANVAAINYHFGSKENLYTETLIFAARKTRTGAVERLCDMAMARTLDSKEDVAKALRPFIRDHFRKYCIAEDPPWAGRLLLHSVVQPSESLKEVVRRAFAPEHEALQQFARRANPKLSEEEIELWIYAMRGMCVFYTLAEAPILILQNRERYDLDFLGAAVEYITRASVEALYLASSNRSPEE